MYEAIRQLNLWRSQGEGGQQIYEEQQQKQSELISLMQFAFIWMAEQAASLQGCKDLLSNQVMRLLEEFADNMSSNMP